MADVEPEVAAAGVPKKRTFKKFAFKGVDLDALLDMSTDDLVKLFSSRNFKWGPQFLSLFLPPSSYLLCLLYLFLLLSLRVFQLQTLLALSASLRYLYFSIA
jgi:hypothetical protein